VKKILLAAALLAVAGSASAFDPNIMFTTVYQCGKYVTVQMNNNSESFKMFTVNANDSDGYPNTIAYQSQTTDDSATNENGDTIYNSWADDANNISLRYELVETAGKLDKTVLIVSDSSGITKGQKVKISKIQCSQVK
jgi:hypothetical protein